MELSERERLREQSEWLRALARRLVGPAGAEDLAQEVALTALEAPPPDDRPVRPWLVRVLRNAVRMGVRADGRRARREQASAPEAAAAVGPDGALALVETSRALCDAVIALDAPLRRAVVGHYVEGASLAELARREGVAEATLRWRHARALTLIREALDRRAGGDRRAWSLALAPFTKLGGVIMKKLVIGAVAAVVAGAGGAWWWRSSRPVTLEPGAATAAVSVEPEAVERAAGLTPDAAAPPAHVRRMANASEERKALVERIAAARRGRAASVATAGGAGVATAGGAGAMRDVDQVLAQLMASMKEVRAFVAECDARTPSPVRRFTGQLTLTGDADVGTLIDASELSDPGGGRLPAAFDDCVRAQMQALVLPPIAVGDAFQARFDFDLDDK